MWSRLRPGSVTAVTPSAWRPARSTAVLTWALATGSRQVIPFNRPPSMVTGGAPSRVLIAAPIARSGSATRSMGRRLIDASPVSTERKGRPASTPASIRIVEPELPTSSDPLAARRPVGPSPSTSTARPDPRTSTPNSFRQRRVEAQSAAVEKLPMRVSPSASAPRIASRWERDLSPGSVKRPRKREAGERRTRGG